MLVIRLQRTGRENLATYRIVVAEKARAVKGKFHEIVGHYLPAQKDPVFKADVARIEEWISKGAAPSNTLARLLKKQGVANMDKFIQRYAKRKSKNPEEAPAAPAPTPAVAEAMAGKPAAAPAAEAAPAVEEKPVETVVEEKAPEAAPVEAPAVEKPAEPAPETPAEEKPAAETGDDKAAA